MKAEIIQPVKTILISLMMVISLCGCTEQHMTQTYGGKMSIVLEPGLKLEEITWKGENNLWILSRPIRDGEEIETHTFQESSSWGIWEGTVTIIETVDEDDYNKKLSEKYGYDITEEVKYYEE